jgi:hypothetical protein
MALYSSNQVRNFFIAKGNAKTAQSSLKTAGDWMVVNQNGVKYFLFVNALGEIIKSDYIENPLYAKYTKASKMQRTQKAYTVTLDESVNGGAPIAGQDYILEINFSEFGSKSPDDQYAKFGCVHADSTMDAASFYQKMAVSLFKNFSREAVNLVEIQMSDEVVVGTAIVDKVEVPVNASGDAITGAAISIVGAEQPWILGVKPQTFVNFTVTPTTVIYNGDEVTWGIAEEDATVEATTAVGNGKDVADMEYFYHGERGDMYRGMGFPNVVHTKYLADETDTYDVVDIHFAFVGSNEAVQKSEKTLTIAFSVASAFTAATVQSSINAILPSDCQLQVVG